jgi:hypothetical protein
MSEKKGSSASVPDVLRRVAKALRGFADPVEKDPQDEASKGTAEAAEGVQAGVEDRSMAGDIGAVVAVLPWIGPAVDGECDPGHAISLYPAVRELAVRLLAGEVLGLVDQQGMRWTARANRLDFVLRGEPGPVLENCTAYDVAYEVVRRSLVLVVEDTLPGVRDCVRARAR